MRRGNGERRRGSGVRVEGGLRSSYVCNTALLLLLLPSRGCWLLI